MTTRYRVEYALKTHRRDQFIEWIKGLLAVPFVLYSQPTGVFSTHGVSMAQMSEEAHRRYAEIMRDVELMIDDHIQHHQGGNMHAAPFPSKLKLLVPSVGPFFTRLPLEAAFKYQDRKRYISSRRYVSPSFNDVRLVLNSAQLMAVASQGSLQLATFDGDVTLYDDGQSLEEDSPVVSRLIDLLSKNVKIGIVTAAGYTHASRYHARLHGLLDTLAADTTLTSHQKSSLVVMGGEANYLFAFSASSPHRLRVVPRQRWLTPEMRAWRDADIASLLDVAERALRDCVANLRLPASVTRKDRAVGILPDPPGARIPRESLEETVLVVQRILEAAQGTAARKGGGDRVPFCAFNGGRDVFVDIGDKSWGVAVCQRWFGPGGGWESGFADAEHDGKWDGYDDDEDDDAEEVNGPNTETAAGTSDDKMRWLPSDAAAPAAGSATMIAAQHTLHVGDQFLSAGANDFRARSVGTTAWIASPAETVELLDELADLMEKKLS